MTNPTIAPIIPNIGNQEAAVAGSSGIIFTGTDRKIIEERSGRIDRNQSFIDLLKERPLTPEVENEETNVKPQQDVKQLEGRYRDHRQMLKHATLYTPKEEVEITNKLPDNYERSKEMMLEPESRKPSQTAAKAASEDKMVNQKTIAIVKELKLDPSQILDKFAIEQRDLHSLVSQLKERHLKRLLTDDRSEFERLSKEIQKETISAAKPEARAWLGAQLDKLTLDAAEYKLNLIKSLQKMELDPKHEKHIKWLKKIIAHLSKS
jgi:hypothetical protein